MSANENPYSFANSVTYHQWRYDLGAVQSNAFRQLKNLLSNPHSPQRGAVVIGPPGSGKSTVIQAAIDDQYQAKNPNLVFVSVPIHKHGLALSDLLSEYCAAVAEELRNTEDDAGFPRAYDELVEKGEASCFDLLKDHSFASRTVVFVIDNLERLDLYTSVSRNAIHDFLSCLRSLLDTRKYMLLATSSLPFAAVERLNDATASLLSGVLAPVVVGPISESESARYYTGICSRFRITNRTRLAQSIYQKTGGILPILNMYASRLYDRFSENPPSVSEDEFFDSLPDILESVVSEDELSSILKSYQERFSRWLIRNGKKEELSAYFFNGQNTQNFPVSLSNIGLSTSSLLCFPNGFVEAAVQYELPVEAIGEIDLYNIVELDLMDIISIELPILREVTSGHPRLQKLLPRAEQRDGTAYADLKRELVNIMKPALGEDFNDLINCSKPGVPINTNDIAREFVQHTRQIRSFPSSGHAELHRSVLSTFTPARLKGLIEPLYEKRFARYFTGVSKQELLLLLDKFEAYRMHFFHPDIGWARSDLGGLKLPDFLRSDFYKTAYALINATAPALRTIRSARDRQQREE